MLGGTGQIWVHLLVSEVQVGSVLVWGVRGRHRVVTREDLLSPLALIEVKLSGPFLEDDFLSVNNPFLPGLVGAQTVVAILPRVQTMILSRQVLGLLHLAFGVICLGRLGKCLARL